MPLDFESSSAQSLRQKKPRIPFKASGLLEVSVEANGAADVAELVKAQAPFTILSALILWRRMLRAGSNALQPLRTLLRR